MKLTILDRMWSRVLNAKEESDTAYFLTLLYAGEQLTKLVTCSLVSLLNEDKEKHRYAQIYNLVRADGIGDWSKSIDEMLIGPTSHYLSSSSQAVRKDLTQKVKAENWQYECVADLVKCLQAIGEEVDDLLNVTQLKNWFAYFARLRNKTRGHGAPLSQVCHDASIHLEKSLSTLQNNLQLFDYQWCFLHQNLSGKYKLSKISEKITEFDYLKSIKDENLSNGVYVFIDRLIKVHLLESDSDTNDFFFPNGGFLNKRYEVISYITGAKETKDNSQFLLPAGELPISETEGVRSLEVIGNCFTNIPSIQSLYIPRPQLEDELKKTLSDDRHPVITLVGKGGIGKTSLALSVLQEICSSDCFDLILWFSARDIDLLEEGAKPVKPDILDELDISKDYVRLVNPSLFKDKDFKPKPFFEKELSNSEIGRLLIVLDNFETVKNPAELFTWLDTFIRLPNKVLITTRFREFKADYPITVSGMKEPEFEALVQSVATSLKINELLTREYLNELYVESGGHPYVAKILLGEVAKEGKLGAIKRIVASQDEILTALFERTYQNLTLAAKRIFLTLSNWKSIIPVIALEAILKRSENELFDVENAVEELYRSSFIDLVRSEKDGSIFISIPLSALLFGKKKLSISSMKFAIEADTSLLMLFGVTQHSQVNDGFKPKADSFFRGIAKRVNEKRDEKLHSYMSILRFICRKHPSSWLSLANLLVENFDFNGTIDALENFLGSSESDENKIGAWKKLSEVYRKISDYPAEAHCLLQLSNIPSTSFITVSNSVDRLNALMGESKFTPNGEQKVQIARQMYDIFKRRLETEQGGADDYSNLAWLCIHLRDANQAKKIVTEILRSYPLHQHSLKLAKSLGL